MKFNWRIFLICIAIPLIVGAAAGLITRGSMETFGMLEQPPLSPPGWLFPVVWTILYTMMGAASYFVLMSGADQSKVRTAILFYSLQLLFNFLWSVFFFNAGLYYFSFAWLIALWTLIIITTVLFFRISKTAGYLMIPYLLWVTFAAYLNLGVAILN